MLKIKIMIDFGWWCKWDYGKIGQNYGWGDQQQKENGKTIINYK